MRYYHGTTDVVAELIKNNGLIPHRETAFQLVNIFGGELRNKKGEQEPYVYLSPKIEYARSFAQFRSEYEEANDGDAVTYFDPLDQDFITFWKIAGSCKCKVNPVVIEFDIPNTFHLQIDPQYHSAGMKVCRCTIPSQYIVKIHKL